MRTRLRSPAIALALLLFAAGFAAGRANAAEPCTAESGALVSVSAGIPPRITWDPPCAVGSLLVEDQWTGADLWIVETPGIAGIPSGVVYGQVPEGASERGPAAPLEPETKYQVALMVWGDGKPARPRVVAHAAFEGGEGGPKSPVPGPECAEGVQLSVVPGSPVRFTWEPACLVHEVAVERADGEDVWFVTAPLEVGIAPGVAYGVAPEGAKEYGQQPLVPGETYHVRLRRAVQDPSSGKVRPHLVATQTFVP